MSEEKIKYNFSNDPSGTHMIVASHVKHGAKVLDIGCSSGYLGEYLVKNRQCEVWGIEPDSESYVVACNKGYKALINKSVEDGLFDQILQNQRFDYIIFADVLEHLIDPERMLRLIRMYLGEGGKVLISVPNIAHYSIRFSLFFGKWEVVNWGILDRTHLHFYTFKALQQLCASAGWKIASIRPRGDLERWFRKIHLESLGKIILFWWPEFFAVQFILELES